VEVVFERRFHPATGPPGLRIWTTEGMPKEMAFALGYRIAGKDDVTGSDSGEHNSYNLPSLAKEKQRNQG